jgi:DNA (cytosine-5)-methyltransferase 1
MTFVPVVANTLLANGGDRHLADAQAGHLIPQHTGTVTTAFDAKNYSNLQEVLSGSVIPVAFAENQRGEVYLSDYQQALTGGGGKPGQGYAAVLAFNGFNGIDMQPSTDVTPTVRAQHIGAPQVLEGGSLAVRRLTPRECERLMGWPDDWTRYADDGAEIADSHRYRMCGNGVVGPVAEWIGRRIVEVEQ